MQRAEHLLTEKREREAKHGTQDGRCGDGGGGIPEGVDEVKLDGQESGHHGETKDACSDDRHDPVHGRTCRPTIPAGLRVRGDKCQEI